MVLDFNKKLKEVYNILFKLKFFFKHSNGYNKFCQKLYMKHDLDIENLVSKAMLLDVLFF